ncbi:SDR family oxidoreductase [Tsuneonella sp. SYSU-LHT278]|uniref:SDR family oxidoreductase n=1 Tax=Tsuneonella sediminis TaxID=3416089 RepID=UPI003F7A42B9
MEASKRPAVLVTGGAKRIGADIAKAFGDAGWHVVIHYGRSAAEAEKLASQLPSAIAIHCNLSDADAAKDMVSRLAAHLPDWRVLINSASIFVPDDDGDIDMENFRKTLRVNAGSPARMAQAFLTHARSKGGKRVIHVTDQKLANPNPDFFTYTMSKHALAATVPMLAMSAAGPEDRVYALAPGAILPSHDQTPEETETSHRLNLLKRRTGPDEIANACLFLAEGWFANGETLYVDSGQHLLAQPRDVIYLARGHAR